MFITTKFLNQLHFYLISIKQTTKKFPKNDKRSNVQSCWKIYPVFCTYGNLAIQLGLRHTPTRPLSSGSNLRSNSFLPHFFFFNKIQQNYRSYFNFHINCFSYYQCHNVLIHYLFSPFANVLVLHDPRRCSPRRKNFAHFAISPHAFTVPYFFLISPLPFVSSFHMESLSFHFSSMNFV